MPILPTSRTVPQTKDIAQVSALPLRVGTAARQDLDSVLVAVDTALDVEANARIAKDNEIAADLAAHVASATAHPASNITAVSQERGYSQGSAVRPVDSYKSINNGTSSTFGQRFTALLTSTINSVRLDLRKVGSPTGTVSVKIYQNSSGVPGSLVATSDSVSVSSIRGESGYLTEFSFSSPASVTSSTDYILTVDTSGITLADVNNYVQVGSDSSASYGKFAVASTNGGSTWSIQSYSLYFQANSAPAVKVQDYLNNIVAEYRALASTETAERYQQDTLLNARVDAEVAQLRATASSPEDKVVTVSSSITTRPDGSQLRLPNGSLLTDFTGGSVNFATAAVTGNVTAPTLINFSGQNGKWAKYSLVLLPTQPDSILVVSGINFYSSLSAAQSDISDPAVSGGIPIAIVIVQDNGSGGTGTINNIYQTNIQQIRASGSGSGGSGSGSPLDPDQESNYIFYARSDFSVDKKLFYGSISGSSVDQVLGLGRIKFTGAGGTFISSNLVGDEQRLEANIINKATLKARYDSSFKDPAPVISLSRDGGATWSVASLTNPAAEGELWLADATWSTQDLLSAGTLTGTVITSQKLALIITPQYDQVITSFDFYLGCTIGTGSITGVIRNVTGSTPTTPLATSPSTRSGGTDVTSTRSYQNFPITPVTLLAGQSYALCVEGASGTILTTETVSSSASWAVSSAYYGWTLSADKYAARLNSSGTDLRAKIVSSAGTEYRLLGFGVDFVLVGPATVSGVSGQETRTITASEASTGILQFTNLTYTPGARQLYAKASNHIFMGPEDFTEISPSQIYFTPGFFSAGQVVTFFVGYGLVDSYSDALTKYNLLKLKLDSMYDAIVGSAAQLIANTATHTSLASALSSYPDGYILVLDEYATAEPVSISGSPLIEGHGRTTNIAGNVTITGNYATVKNLRFGGNLTITGSANFVRECHASGTSVVSDSGTANSKLIIVE